MTITKREKDIPLHRGFKETHKLFFSQIGDAYKKDKSNMKSLMQQIALQMTIVLISLTLIGCWNIFLNADLKINTTSGAL